MAGVCTAGINYGNQTSGIATLWYVDHYPQHHLNFANPLWFKLQCLEDIKLKTGELIHIQRISKLSRATLSWGSKNSFSFIPCSLGIHGPFMYRKILLGRRKKVNISWPYQTLHSMHFLVGIFGERSYRWKTCIEGLNILLFNGRLALLWNSDGNEVIPKWECPVAYAEKQWETARTIFPFS